MVINWNGIDKEEKYKSHILHLLKNDIEKPINEVFVNFVDPLDTVIEITVKTDITKVYSYFPLNNDRISEKD